MIKNIKNSFDLIIKNSAVMQPIILFILFLMFFNMFMGMNVLYNPNMGIIFIILSVLLFSAFISGWLYTIKYAVDNYKKFDKKDPEYAVKIGKYNIDTLKKFFIGVGEYFIPALFVVIISIVTSNLLIYAGLKLLHINNLDFLIKSFSAQTAQDLPKFNLTQAIFLMYIALITFVFHFITLFWLPEIFYKTKNSIIALFKSVVFLFGHFLTSVILYAFLIFIFFVFQFLSIFAMLNQILVLIMFILFLYLITYSIVLIFMTYKDTMVKNEIKKINEKDIFIKSDEDKGNEF